MTNRLVIVALVAMTFVAGTGLQSGRAATPTANEDGQTKHFYYTTSSSAPALELQAIEVTGSKITTTDIGPINAGGCASLAMYPSGTPRSMCGDLFGAQRLASIDTKTGPGTMFGVPVPGSPKCFDQVHECSTAASNRKGVITAPHC